MSRSEHVVAGLGLHCCFLLKWVFLARAAHTHADCAVCCALCRAVCRGVPHTLTSWVCQFSRVRAWRCCSSLPMQTAHLMHGEGEGWKGSGCERVCVCVSQGGYLCEQGRWPATTGLASSACPKCLWECPAWVVDAAAWDVCGRGTLGVHCPAHTLSVTLLAAGRCTQHRMQTTPSG